MPLMKGTYNYFVEGALRATEPWEVEHVDESHWRVHSERLAGESGVVELDAVIGESVRHFAFSFTPHAESSAAISSEYLIDCEHLLFRPGGVSEWERVGSNKTLFFGLFRLFMGTTIIRIAEAAGKAQVVVPDIRDPGNPETLFQPVVSTRRAWKCPDRVGEYRYQGGEYREPLAVDIAPEGLMRSYRWQPPEGPEWSCELDPGSCRKGWAEGWSRLQEFL